VGGRRLHLLALAAIPLWAADPPQPQTRAGLIQTERDRKAAEVEPPEPSGLHRFLKRVEQMNVPERLMGTVPGWRPVFGGLISGAGFVTGPEYRRPDLAGGKARFRVSARGSAQEFYGIETGLRFRELAGKRLDLEVMAGRHGFPSLDYFGPGPDSRKTGRTDYLFEDTTFGGEATVHLYRHLRAGAEGSYVLLNIGPGRDGRYAPANLVYTPTQAPGIDLQPNFVRGGAFLEFDNRDNPGGPRRGGLYGLRLARWSDRQFGRYSFDRIEAEAQHYFSFFNQQRVIALRARTVLSRSGDGHSVPFYLQPTLGGSHDLRGFHTFRFHDDNSLVLNAEYRWDVFSGLDMAVFADAGKVFPRWSGLDLHNLEADYGFGLRFNARNDVFLRVDVAFSHEGYRIWFSFSNVF
jgi:hypothetical protein